MSKRCFPAAIHPDRVDTRVVPPCIRGCKMRRVRDLWADSRVDSPQLTAKEAASQVHNKLGGHVLKTMGLEQSHSGHTDSYLPRRVT